MIVLEDVNWIRRFS